jgi:hypothetical protein
MTSQSDRITNEKALIRSAVARLRAGIMAIVCGMFAGTGLLVATAWLVVRGGQNVGQHLGLLRYYLPGYSVTWPGAIVGFLYGAVIGGVIGCLTAWIYNRVVELRLSNGGHGSAV